MTGYGVIKGSFPLCCQCQHMAILSKAPLFVPLNNKLMRWEPQHALSPGYPIGTKVYIPTSTATMFTMPPMSWCYRRGQGQVTPYSDYYLEHLSKGPVYVQQNFTLTNEDENPVETWFAFRTQLEGKFHPNPWLVFTITWKPHAPVADSVSFERLLMHEPVCSIPVILLLLIVYRAMSAVPVGRTTERRLQCLQPMTKTGSIDEEVPYST